MGGSRTAQMSRITQNACNLDECPTEIRWGAQARPWSLYIFRPERPTHNSPGQGVYLFIPDSAFPGCAGILPAFFNKMRARRPRTQDQLLTRGSAIISTFFTARTRSTGKYLKTLETKRPTVVKYLLYYMCVAVFEEEGPQKRFAYSLFQSWQEKVYNF